MKFVSFLLGLAFLSSCSFAKIEDGVYYDHSSFFTIEMPAHRLEPKIEDEYFWLKHLSKVSFSFPFGEEYKVESCRIKRETYDDFMSHPDDEILEKTKNAYDLNVTTRELKILEIVNISTFNKAIFGLVYIPQERRLMGVIMGVNEQQLVGIFYSPQFMSEESCPEEIIKCKLMEFASTYKNVMWF